MKDYYCFRREDGSFVAEDYDGPTSGSTDDFLDKSVYSMVFLKDAVNFVNSYHLPLSIYKVAFDKKSDSVNAKLKKVTKDEVFAVAKEQLTYTVTSHLNADYITGENSYLNAVLTSEAATEISCIVNDALRKVLGYIEKNNVFKNVGSFE